MNESPLHPLVARLIEAHGYPYPATEEELARLDDRLLFLPAHGKGHMETPDIAVVLPELVRAFGQPLAGAVAGPECERRLRDSLGGIALPAIVVLRAGKPVGSISRMRDWDEYLERLGALLAEPAPVSH